MCFVVAYVVYRWLFNVHANFGQLFKSLFDTFREEINIDDVVKEVGELIADSAFPALPPRQKCAIAGHYLTNYKIDVGGTRLRPKAAREQSLRARAGVPLEQPAKGNSSSDSITSPDESQQPEKNHSDTRHRTEGRQ